MLDVRYEAVDDLTPGRLARIDEDRATIRVRVDKSAPLAAVVQQLNVEIDEFLATSYWFQLWRKEIVSRGTPDCSLRVEYLLEKEDGHAVCVKERRGLVSVYIDPALTTEQFVAAMNPATQEHLAGGRWFQMYAGEIITQV